MDFFITLTIKVLEVLSNLVGGNFGWGIIILTIAVRLCMWSLSFSQQKSMREMQRLQPELKRIQERYKSDPQMMQQKMMEFYKKHNFNPTSGCLPLLVQMPIFILLYSALISPQFTSMAGNSQFYFIKRLDATLKGTTGVSYNGNFEVTGRDVFTIQKGKITVTFENGETETVKLNDKKSLVVMGRITPGEDIDFKISLDKIAMKFSQLDKIKSAKADIMDTHTREIETIEFSRQSDFLKSSVPTVKTTRTLNYDVLILILLFGITMYFAQEVMMTTQKGQRLDPQQESMQKMMKYTMPIFLTAIFVFGPVPIPAGVLLYMLVSNLFQIVQTFIMNQQLDASENIKDTVYNDDLADVKKVEAKEVKTIDSKKRNK